MNDPSAAATPQERGAAVEPADPDVEPVEEPAAPEEPLNRAARRARAKQADPSHVGPRQGHAPQRGGGGRGSTKRAR